MNVTSKATRYGRAPETEALIEKTLAAVSRLLGDESEGALLEIEIEKAPPEGRSSEPIRLEARLTVKGDVFYAEATKPNPESAADKVRSELEAELRRQRGRARKLWRRGGAALKRMLRFGR